MDRHSRNLIHLGCDFFIVGDLTFGRPFGLAGGIIAATTALFFWFGIEFLRRDRDDQLDSPFMDENWQTHRNEGEFEQLAGGTWYPHQVCENQFLETPMPVGCGRRAAVPSS